MVKGGGGGGGGGAKEIDVDLIPKTSPVVVLVHCTQPPTTVHLVKMHGAIIHVYTQCCTYTSI